MGAWIEIYRFYPYRPEYSSHPVWVRGLKYRFIHGTCVAPLVGVRIEKVGIYILRGLNVAPRVWVRGLKSEL